MSQIGGSFLAKLINLLQGACPIIAYATNVSYARMRANNHNCHRQLGGRPCNC